MTQGGRTGGKGEGRGEGGWWGERGRKRGTETQKHRDAETDEGGDALGFVGGC